MPYSVCFCTFIVIKFTLFFTTVYLYNILWCEYFSLSLPKSIYKLFLGTCVWLLWIVYSTMPTLCTKHLLYMKTEEWCYCSKYSWRISLYQFSSDKKHISIARKVKIFSQFKNDKMVKDTEMEIYGHDFKLLLVWIV